MPLELIYLSSQELRALPPSRCVFVFATGVLADHGPHLPVGLDWIEAQALARGIAEQIEKLPGEPWHSILVPAAPMGASRPHRGLALRVRAPVLRDWLVDSCRALEREGFTKFVCVSGDLGARELCAIEDAGRMLMRLNRVRTKARRVFFIAASSALSVPRDAWRNLLPSTWIQGTASSEHGGAMDTAVAQALIPQYPGLKLAAALPTVDEPPREGGYWGAPAQAGKGSNPAGAQILAERLQIVWPRIRTVLEDGASPRFLFQSWHSIFLWNRSTFYGWVLAAFIMSIVFIWATWSL